MSKYIVEFFFVFDFAYNFSYFFSLFSFFELKCTNNSTQSDATDSFNSWYTPSMVCVNNTSIVQTCTLSMRLKKTGRFVKLHTTKRLGAVARERSNVRLFEMNSHRRTYTRPLTWSSLIAIRRVSYKYVSNLFKWFFSICLTDTISHTTELLN